ASTARRDDEAHHAPPEAGRPAQCGQGARGARRSTQRREVLMAVPPVPPQPPGMSPMGPGPGGTAPASPMNRESGGKLARAKVTGGLGLMMLRLAAISAAQSGRPGMEFAATIDKHISGLSKILSEPDHDVGASELDFMKSQLPQGAPPQAK